MPVYAISGRTAFVWAVAGGSLMFLAMLGAVGGLGSFPASGPSTRYRPVHVVVAQSGAQTLDADPPVLITLDHLEVPVGEPVLARHEVALLAAVPFRERKVTAAQRRIFGGPSGIVLHLGDVAEQQRQFFPPQVLL